MTTSCPTCGATREQLDLHEDHCQGWDEGSPAFSDEEACLLKMWAEEKSDTSFMREWRELRAGAARLSEAATGAAHEVFPPAHPQRKEAEHFIRCLANVEAALDAARDAYLRRGNA